MLLSKILSLEMEAYTVPRIYKQHMQNQHDEH